MTCQCCDGGAFHVGRRWNGDLCSLQLTALRTVDTVDTKQLVDPSSWLKLENGSLLANIQNCAKQINIDCYLIGDVITIVNEATLM